MNKSPLMSLELVHSFKTNECTCGEEVNTIVTIFSSFSSSFTSLVSNLSTAIKATT